ncbi:hypothetical protein LCGC14_2992620, partial [marine sediment metagenome]
HMYRPALSHDTNRGNFLVSAHQTDADNIHQVMVQGVPDLSGGGGGGAASSGGGGGCFIATAAYGSYSESHVMVLRNFRDEVLFKSAAGTALVNMYYAYSPPVADYIASHGALRAATRIALAPVVGAVKHPGFALMLMGFVVAGAGESLRRRRRK